MSPKTMTGVSGVASRVATDENGSLDGEVPEDQGLVVGLPASDPTIADRETGSTHEPVTHSHHRLIEHAVLPA